MFAKLFSLTSLAILAAATPNTSAAGLCSTGASMCCQTMTTAKNPAASTILKSLGVVVQDLNVPVGLTCSPITVFGATVSDCSVNSVCCQDNSHGEAIAIGCVPVTA